MKKRGRSRRSHRILLIFCALFAGGVVEISVAAESDAEIPQPLEVEEAIYLGSLPAKKGLQLDGVDLVIDLRYPYEGVYDERGTLSGLSIRSVNIPVSSRGPTIEDVEKLSAVIDESDGEHVLIHDSNGHRTAMIWGAYRLWQGAELDSALAELQPIYDSAELRPVLERFSASLAAVAAEASAGEASAAEAPAENASTEDASADR